MRPEHRQGEPSAVYRSERSRLSPCCKGALDERGQIGRMVEAFTQWSSKRTPPLDGHANMDSGLDGRRFARPVIVRSAGAVPSMIAAMMRGERKSPGVKAGVV